MANRFKMPPLDPGDESSLQFALDRIEIFLNSTASPLFRVVRKTADETVNNSATLQNDDHLLLTVGASDVWLVDMRLMLSATSTTPDWKFAFTVPAGATFRWGAEDLTTIGGWVPVAVGTSAPALSTTGTVTAGSSGSVHGSHLTGIYVGGGTAGTLQFQWAQNTATVADSKVLTNSCLIATKLN